MLPIPSFLTGQLWKAGTFAAGAAALALAVALGVTTLQKNAAVKRADGLYAQIHAPVTGYAARLKLCAGNVGRLDAARISQNNAVERLRAASAERIVAAERGLVEAQERAAAARYQARRLAAAPIAGTTVCDRMGDVDRQVLEMLR